MARSNGGPAAAGFTTRNRHLGLASLYALVLVLILFAAGLATPDEAAGEANPAESGVETVAGSAGPAVPERASPPDAETASTTL